jgi:hypothetical protein
LANWITQVSTQALPPELDPPTVQGLRDEQKYRDVIGAAMAAANVDAIVFPVWTFPPKLNGDRQTPNGALTYIGSATQWPVIAVPMGFVDDNLPVGMQILGRPWTESVLIKYAYAFEQGTHHRRPPPAVPPLMENLRSKFIGTWRLIAIRDRDEVSHIETPSIRGADGGQLIYSANGCLSVQISRINRRRDATADGFASYFGRWELDPKEGCVIHHQDGNLSVIDVGKAPKRYYSFDAEGHLSLATPPKMVNGRETRQVFVWERIP